MPPLIAGKAGRQVQALAAPANLSRALAQQQQGGSSGTIPGTSSDPQQVAHTTGIIPLYPPTGLSPEGNQVAGVGIAVLNNAGNPVVLLGNLNVTEPPASLEDDGSPPPSGLSFQDGAFVLVDADGNLVAGYSQEYGLWGFGGEPGSGGANVTDGTTTVDTPTTIEFAGATVSNPTGGEALVTITGGSGAAPTVTDGTHSVAAPTTIEFAGATVSNPTGGEALVTITGGGGGGGGVTTKQAVFYLETGMSTGGGGDWTVGATVAYDTIGCVVDPADATILLLPQAKLYIVECVSEGDWNGASYHDSPATITVPSVSSLIGVFMNFGGGFFANGAVQSAGGTSDAVTCGYLQAGDTTPPNQGPMPLTQRLTLAPTAVLGGFWTRNSAEDAAWAYLSAPAAMLAFVPMNASGWLGSPVISPAPQQVDTSFVVTITQLT